MDIKVKTSLKQMVRQYNRTKQPEEPSWEQLPEDRKFAFAYHYGYVQGWINRGVALL